MGYIKERTNQIEHVNWMKDLIIAWLIVDLGDYHIIYNKYRMQLILTDDYNISGIVFQLFGYFQSMKQMNDGELTL